MNILGRRSGHHIILSIVIVLVVIKGSVRAAPDELPQRVEFPSRDGHTTLVGYLFLPAHPASPKTGAIVMMHGRAGPYSTSAHGVYDASTLSKRHAFWGHLWASRGYIALLVDGFGPRGYPSGFPIHSYADRPDAVNEVTVRPLDAYGALAFLQTRPDIDPGRIGLQGWSNGGSATIATMSDDTLRGTGLPPARGFQAAIAFYPACSLHQRFRQGYRPYAPLRIFSGDADEEVSAETCQRLVDHAAGGDIKIEVYPGATHDFDDPGRKRQSVPENAAAAAAAIAKAQAFIDSTLGASRPTQKTSAPTVSPSK